MKSRLAGPSRLAFDVPQGETIPLTLEGVLEALQRLPLRVSPVNRWEPPGCLNPVGWVAQRPAVAEPGADITAIEAPYRLILSPDQLATWSHAPEPVTRGDWTELWHTRLGTARSGGDPRVRAIWSPDFRANSLQPRPNDNDPPPEPFLMSLHERDRNEIVHLTSNYRSRWFSRTHREVRRDVERRVGEEDFPLRGDDPPAGTAPSRADLGYRIVFADAIELP